MECCFGINSNQLDFRRIHVLRAFPWVGIYFYALLLNRKKIRYLIFAFVLLFVFFYFLYLGSYYLWNFFLFHKAINPGTDENFYVLCALLEMASILFIRTRSSFYFLPKFWLLLLFAYLYYVNTTAFGFYSLAFYIVMYFCIFFLGITLTCFEIPALSWNPSFHYVPNLERPRTLYFSLFSMSNYHDLPQFWSMFYPLHDRSNFTEQQMALMDRNYLLLSQTLRSSLNMQVVNVNNAGDIEMQFIVNNDGNNNNNIQNQNQQNENNVNVERNNNPNSDLQERLLPGH